MKKSLLLLGSILVIVVCAAFLNSASERILFSDHGWHYDSAAGRLQIPLLGQFGIARAGERLGFIVTAQIEIYNVDGSLAGVAEGSGKIDVVGSGRIDQYYVKIAPLTVDLAGEDWYGDDDGTSLITGTVQIRTSRGILLGESAVAQFKVQDDFPVQTRLWGRLANPGFNNQEIKTTLFFSGQARDGSQHYECFPAENLGLFTVHPSKQSHLRWSMDPKYRDTVVGEMTGLGLNTVSMSSWGEDFLPCGTGWSLIAPMQSAAGSHDELFEAAAAADLVIIPFIESRNDWALRDEFPTTPDGKVAPGAVSQITNLIERYLQNPEHPEWAEQWAQVWDRSLEPRYAITFIHASSNRISGWEDRKFAQGFDLLAEEVYQRTGVKIGFFIDPLPPYSNAPGIYKPIPESAGPELRKAESILGIQAFIPEIWHPGNPSQQQLIAYKLNFSQRWSGTGLPFLMDVSPGYDASVVFPNSIVYGFTEEWMAALTDMVRVYGEDGLVYNSWNGYTEGMAAVPTLEYGDDFTLWLEELISLNP